jgi:proline iminopeptidase
VVPDIERIRVELGIDAWPVFGRSWGAYLALRYGAEHAGRCLGFLLFGAFLPEAEAVEALYERPPHEGSEAWEAYRAASRRREGQAILAAYAERIVDGDHAAALAAASEFAAYHKQLASNGAAAIAAHHSGHPPEEVLAFVGLQNHYARNMYFSQGHGLGDLLAKLWTRPCRLVHGGGARG